MRCKFYALCWMFLLGCFVYSLLEITARGYTHWTMTLTGGMVAAVLYYFYHTTPSGTLLLRCFCGALFITALEMVVGVFVNLRFGWAVWDYSNIPLNLYGQICLPFSCLWFLACFPAYGICHFVQKRLEPEKSKKQ